jgi:hypothetical protein
MEIKNVIIFVKKLIQNKLGKSRKKEKKQADQLQVYRSRNAAQKE